MTNMRQGAGLHWDAKESGMSDTPQATKLVNRLDNVIRKRVYSAIDDPGAMAPRRNQSLTAWETDAVMIALLDVVNTFLVAAHSPAPSMERAEQ